MKSLLSENMLRFGTKNLTATSKQELIVKSIMETIDQHGLRKTIYNRLVEQTDPNAEGVAMKNQGAALKVLGIIMSATGGIGTNHTEIARALKMIKTLGGQPVYDELLKLVQTSPKVKNQYDENFDTVIDLIATEYFHVGNSRGGHGGGDIISKDKWVYAYKTILSVYNDDEGGEYKGSTNLSNLS